MSVPYTVECELRLLPTGEGGFRTPMTAPTPSLLFAFWDVEDVKQEIQMGAMISGPLILIPGTMVFAQAMFWDDLGRVLATPGTNFKLCYAGRIVGVGRVLRVSTGVTSGADVVVDRKS